jgi:hypothetical protein
VGGTVTGPANKEYDVYITAKPVPPPKPPKDLPVGSVKDLNTAATGSVKYALGPVDTDLQVGATYEIEASLYPAGADPKKTKPITTGKKKYKVVLPETGTSGL